MQGVGYLRFTLAGGGKLAAVNLEGGVLLHLKLYRSVHVVIHVVTKYALEVHGMC